jgi:tight adherence protein B
MNAATLVPPAGALLVGGSAWFWWRTRRPVVRLVRLTRSRPERSAPGGPRLELILLRRPVLTGVAVLAVVSGGAFALSGPVAAVLLGVYSAMALLAVRLRLVRRDAERFVARLLDAVDATAEGLRAGALPDGSPVRALPDAASDRWAGASAEVPRARLAAAYVLSETLGVPLVDLLERVEADLRSGQALRADMGAQLAGAQTATAVLLPLPLVGLWVGAVLGTDPLRQLLHTPLGAACAVSAVAMQGGGLLWTSRMVRSATAEVH